jgi:membrane-bound serine protease (ClpP class)
VFVEIDSPGGSPADSAQLANFLAFDLDPGKVRTVAYVPQQARGDAALIALACDDIVVGRSAILGGPGDYDLNRREIDEVTVVLRDKLAPRKGRSWSLPVAMFDPKLEVFEFTHLDKTGFFSEDEVKTQPDAADWKKQRAVTSPRDVFAAKGKEAVDFQLAARVADDSGDLVRAYGLDRDPMHVAPGWVDMLVRGLASPWVAALLFVVGGVAIYIELQAPGVGLGGFLAAVCFALFFWSRFLGGTADWLEVILFAIGVGFILLEVFVLPGMGIFGIGGGLLILVSLVLASQTFILPHNSYQFGRVVASIWTLFGGVAGAILAIALLHRWLPKMPVVNRMFLEPFSPAEADEISRREALADYSELLGQQGVATTILKPGGKARIGDREYPVISDGEIIARGTRVVVVEAAGNRIVVQTVG